MKERREEGKLLSYFYELGNSIVKSLNSDIAKKRKREAREGYVSIEWSQNLDQDLSDTASHCLS